MFSSSFHDNSFDPVVLVQKAIENRLNSFTHSGIR